jgi:hypothetical protein
MLTKEEHDFYEVTGELVYFEKEFKCIVRKDSHLGHLCGYIVIPKEHPFYGMYRDHIPLAVHGGITYANHEDDDYVIGFDCAHAEDLVPGIVRDLELAGYVTGVMRRFPFPATYKDLSYVKGEISHMIRQVELLEYNPITYKKAGKMALKGRWLFYKGSDDAGMVYDIGEYKSLTHFIVREQHRYTYDPVSPAQVMASTWYLVKEMG